MTEKARALTTVHQVAKQREDEHATQLKLAQDEHDKHQKYLSDLESYRSSYSELASQKGASGVSSAMFRHYQGFLHSIDLGINQQHTAINNMAADLNKKREHWQHAHLYSEAVQSMIDKHQAEQHKIEGKREQAIADEMNLRNYVRTEEE